MARYRIGMRKWIQIGFTALSNGYVNGFLKGKLYQGDLKQFCVPGLNCYSCPGALGSCPIGALQAVISSPQYKFSLYIIGFLVAVGALFGRAICGFLCPFGLVQELLHRIPFPFRVRTFPGDKRLRHLKYVVLAILVLWLPMTAVNIVGQGDPWFCKFVCPSGTLMGGIPQLILNPALRDSIGGLFYWKIGVLIAVLFISIINYRPFCKYLCPLGAIYGLLNPVSIIRHSVDSHACTHCGACKSACPMQVQMPEKPNDPECVRCGACKAACPHGAIKTSACVKSAKKGRQHEAN